jgi:hypothetical protein
MRFFVFGIATTINSPNEDEALQVYYVKLENFDGEVFVLDTENGYFLF